MPRIPKKKTKQLLKFESEKYKTPPDRSIFGVIELLSFNVLPRVIPNGWRNTFSIPHLIDFTNALGLTGDKIEQSVLDHQKRLVNRVAIYLLVFAPIIFIFVFVPFLVSFIVLAINGFSPFLSIPIFLFIGVPVELFLIKAVYIFLDKYYADSLCIQTSLGVLVELTNPDVLTNPVRKRFLLFYINSVARYVLLLHLCFRGSSETANNKIREHFNKIERFVREQERLATIPDEDALESLREAFLMLTHIFISGNYGSLKWDEDETIVQMVPEIPLEWYQRIGVFVGKIVGVAVPLTGLYYIYTNPALFSGWPIDTNSLTLLAIAWLFLSIDSVLQLGLTAKVLATAKEIKDLI